MSEDLVYTLGKLKAALDPVFQAYGVRSAVLFGSYAKGCADRSSDVDILVDSGLRGLRFFGLLESVSSALRVPVDLLDVTQIEPDSRIDLEIQNSGVRIYGQ
ncbi:MAG: nucleotidyltransferase domain-containing protein [Oscillospiraceae bacterium]|nr:nucleotidyltransferase domain-containing protein [Oscillospiraceae bacterium]